MAKTLHHLDSTSRGQLTSSHIVISERSLSLDPARLQENSPSGLGFLAWSAAGESFVVRESEALTSVVMKVHEVQWKKINETNVIVFRLKVLRAPLLIEESPAP